MGVVPPSRIRKVTMQQIESTKKARTETEKGRQQTFTFESASAKSIQLVGDFTQWEKQPIPLHKDSGSVWRATVQLQPGPHRYRFLVDGQWQNDPACALRVANPYGSEDCLRKVA